MIMGINPASELKEVSIKQKRPFSEILLQYIQENFLMNISESKYKDEIWIRDCFPWEREDNKEKIYMYFQKKHDHTENTEYVEKMLSSIISISSKSEIKWNYYIKEKNDKIIVSIEAIYKKMNVPILIEFEEIITCEILPEIKNFKLMLRSVKSVEFNVYKPETKIVDSLFEIMEKLELINDMEAYAIINTTLKTRSVSGRRVIDGLSVKTCNKPKVRNEKRVEQIKSYKKYSYMKKRWDKYCKNHIEIEDSWEEVVDRIVNFIGPVWKALCRNEIFFDDWMPELGRFLG